LHSLYSVKGFQKLAEEYSGQVLSLPATRMPKKAENRLLTRGSPQHNYVLAGAGRTTTVRERQYPAKYMALELLNLRIRDEGSIMMVATGLAVLVVFCLLLSMVETPPDVGR
jgi:hypothetical protein